MGRKNTKFLSALAVIFTLFSPSSFANQGACGIIPVWPELETSDLERLIGLNQSRTKGLSAALKSTNNQDQEYVASLYENDFSQIDNPNELIGKYRCRTIKLGGLSEITIYKWFKCEIWSKEQTLLIKKTTGSQNFMGVLVPAGEGLSYSGALNYGYEKIYKLYSQDKQRNQVGCLSAIDKDMISLILEMPAPKFESFHDIILLEKEN